MLSAGMTVADVWAGARGNRRGPDLAAAHATAACECGQPGVLGDEPPAFGEGHGIQSSYIILPAGPAVPSS